MSSRGAVVKDGDVAISRYNSRNTMQEWRCYREIATALWASQ